MPGHGSGHPRPGEPGADHQIRLAGTERSQQPRHLGRPVAVVAVEEDDDVGSGDVREAGQAGAPVATSGLTHDAGA